MTLPVSLTAPTETPFIPPVGTPQWLVDLRSQFDTKNDDQLCEAVSKLFGTLPLENVPRPGQAKGFALAEWRSWGLANCFVEVRDGTHGHIFEHKLLGILCRWSRSDHGGDFRASMALAMQIRRSLRESYLYVAYSIKFLIDAMISGKFHEDLPRITWSSREEFQSNFIPYFLTNIYGSSGIRVEDIIQQTNYNSISGTDFLRLLNVVRNEFKLSYRQTLEVVMPTAQKAEAPVMAKIMTTSPETYRVPTYINAAVREFLQAKREEVEEEKAQRQLKRAQQKDGTAMKEVPVMQLAAKPDDIKQVFESRRTDVLRRVSGLANLQETFQSQIDALAEVVARWQIPVIPAPDTTKIQDLESKVASLELENEVLKQRQAELLKMEKELAEARELLNDDPCKKQYDSLVKAAAPLAGDITAAQKNMAIGKIAEHFEKWPLSVNEPELVS